MKKVGINIGLATVKDGKIKPVRKGSASDKRKWAKRKKQRVVSGAKAAMMRAQRP